MDGMAPDMRAGGNHRHKAHPDYGAGHVAPPSDERKKSVS